MTRKPLQPGAEDDQEAEVARRELRLGEVVLGDLAADRDPGAEREPPEHGLGERAADVVEVHVDAVRARLLERGVDVVRLVVDADVVAVELGQVAAPSPGRPRSRRPASSRRSSRAARRAGRRRPPRLRRRPCRPASRSPTSKSPKYAVKPGNAEHMERGLHRRERRIDLAERAAARDRVVLPAELADDDVARGEPRVAALDDLADRLPGHRLADLRSASRRSAPRSCARACTGRARARAIARAPRPARRLGISLSTSAKSDSCGIPTGRAASVICLFTEPGLSHIDAISSGRMRGEPECAGSPPVDLPTRRP